MTEMFLLVRVGSVRFILHWPVDERIDLRAGWSDLLIHCPEDLPSLPSSHRSYREASRRSSQSIIGEVSDPSSKTNE